MEKAPFFFANKVYWKGVAGGWGWRGCIHERHLLLQEMYVTGVLPITVRIVMLVALPGVSVTFRSADQQQRLTCSKQKKTLEPGCFHCRLNQVDLKVFWLKAKEAFISHASDNHNRESFQK